MHRLIIILFFICVKFNLVLAQLNFNIDLTENKREPREQKDQWHENKPKGFEFVPSGSYLDTVFINDDTVIKTISVAPFWMSNEITNKEFREFNTYLNTHSNDSLCYYDLTPSTKNNDKSGMEKAKNFVCFSNREIAKDLLDSNRFKAQNPELSDYYYNKKYNNYPIIGVSFNGARFYSIWKTKREREINRPNYRMNDYRIPAEDEYKYIISRTKDRNWPKNNSLYKINSGIRNYYNLYNICSNASEWAYKSSDNSQKEPTIIKGSWNSKENSGNDFVGFRLVRSYLSEATR